MLARFRLTPTAPTDEQRSSRSRRRTVASPRLSTTRWPSRLPTLTRVGTSRGGAAAAKERDVFAPTSAAGPRASARLGRRFIEAAVRRRDAACLASPASKRARTGRGAIAFVLPPARTALLQRHGCGSRVDRVAVTVPDRRVVRSAQPAAAASQPPARWAALPHGRSRNTGDADLGALLLAVAEVQPDDDVRLCERSADLCDSHTRRPFSSTRSRRVSVSSRRCPPVPWRRAPRSAWTPERPGGSVDASQPTGGASAWACHTGAAPGSRDPNACT